MDTTELTARPRSLVWLTVATAVAALLCLLFGLGWGAGLEGDYASLPADAEAVGETWLAFPSWPLQLSWPWLIAFAVGGLALALVWRRGRAAPAWLLGFWTFALGFVPMLWPAPDLLEAFLTAQPPESVPSAILQNAQEPLRWGLVFLALVAPWLLVSKVTLGRRFRRWFGSPTFGLSEGRSSVGPDIHARGTEDHPRDGEPARMDFASRSSQGGVWDRVRPVALAALLGALWSSIGYLRIFVWDDENKLLGLFDAVQGIVFAILSPGMFIACTGLILWLWFERLSVDESGVRLFVFSPRYTMFFARWDRVRSLEVVDHGRGPASVSVRYRSRFGLPFTLGVHAKRYVGGEDLLRGLVAAAEGRTVRIQRWRSPDRARWAGWCLLALGVILLIAQNVVMHGLARAFQAPQFTDSMDRLAGLAPLTALHSFAVLAIGAGFGLMSAHHRGGSRPVLLILLMVATGSLPDPVIWWLVWTAIYAILSARLQPIESLPGLPVPAPSQWDLAYTVLTLAPLIVAVGYYIGLFLGRRPMSGGV